MIYEGNVFQTKLLCTTWGELVLTGAVHVPADDSLPGWSACSPCGAAQPVLPRRSDDGGGAGGHAGVSARQQGEVRHQSSL